MDMIKRPVYRFIVFALLFLEISLLYQHWIPWLAGICAGISLAFLVAGLYKNNNQPHCLIGITLYFGLGMLLHYLHTFTFSQFLWLFFLGAIFPLWISEGFANAN